MQVKQLSKAVKIGEKACSTEIIRRLRKATKELNQLIMIRSTITITIKNPLEVNALVRFILSK